MVAANQHLFILFNCEWLNEKAIRQTSQSVHQILQDINSPSRFCTSFELVNRNSITQNPKIMLREAAHFRLRSFRFFIGKN